ncbi:MAG: CDP-alcohol phosphatidyltransferase family protein [Acidobacteria bacterium]|jgi:phosphatidylglycerophosphate synthase|nr:CDP-alcohol phosphatidyltransferase family protein [Acidobacteriota bacterium]
MVASGMKKEDPFYQAQLKKDRQGFWARYLNVENWINRPLASLLVRLLFHSPVTPNQLTVVAFILGLGAAALFAVGSAASSMGAAVLCEIALVFDCADGMLARARNSCSRFGSFLDLFLDRISDFTVMLGVAVGFYRAGGADKDRLILGLLVISLYMLQVILYYIFNRFLDAQNGESGEGRALGIFIFFILGMLNRLDLIIYAMLAETVLNLVYRVSCFLLAGWRSERQQLPL